MSANREYTVKEVARILRVSERTVRNLIERNRFPGAYRLDPKTRSTWRIPERDVLEFQRLQKEQ